MNTIQKSLSVLLLSILLSPGLMAQHYPEKLIEQDSVAYQRTERTFGRAKFEGLQQRYRSIKGIVMVGIMNGEGEVLLKGPDNWAPPGGPVQPGQDWEEAAQTVMEEQTGNAISNLEPVLVEEMVFRPEGSPGDSSFSAYILHYTAVFSGPDPVVSDSSFQWFDAVPEDAHHNHTGHIRLYLQ